MDKADIFGHVDYIRLPSSKFWITTLREIELWKVKQNFHRVLSFLKNKSQDLRMPPIFRHYVRSHPDTHSYVNQFVNPLESYII
ncbi:hypothetical protein CEXT_50131 [Caerostris extrusa]|uniref:Uncharacterized protein n=1 Tax=Caerostris extrusa TaxID=172846 RepID=A0AAV4RSG0_CAEEX|nr:hypothetical protein CEXT_50131 [Caerostris extrusa]